MKNNLSNIFLTISALSFLLFTLSFVGSSYAQLMTNGIYVIQAGNLNSFAGKATGTGGTVTFTGGQTAIGLYSGSNYKVRAGFQYIYSVIPFTFSISNIEANFGTLTPGEPITRNTLLTVSNGSAFGYQVTASENHAPRVNQTGFDIPDTTCDSGTCTQTTAAAWTSPLTYGFGYRCDDVSGTDCNTDFSNSTYYKQFANLENGESPVSVMSSPNVGRSRQSRITYKINISATQPAGIYQNIIQYIATPTI